jgi:uncharacterized RDD family membrane protein YckC
MMRPVADILSPNWRALEEPVAAVPEEFQPAVGISPIAGFWRRLTAFGIDWLILGLPALLLGLALFRWVASLGQAGRLIGFVVALLYFGLLNSRLGGGQTVGKRLLGIRVIDQAGNELSPARSISRFLVIAIPIFLNGLWMDVDYASLGAPEYVLGALLIFAVFGGLGAIIYLFVFNRRTRQSLHDLAVGSFVVRGPPAPVPIGVSIARLHLIVISGWLGLVLILPPIGIWAVRQSSLTESLKPLSELQAAIKMQLGLRQVRVTMGNTTFAAAETQAGFSKPTSFLQVDVQPDAPQEDLDALVPVIAGAVLDLHPDLLGQRLLIVQVQRAFDLGIVRWSQGRREALDAAAWREKLRQVRARPNKT